MRYLKFLITMRLGLDSCFSFLFSVADIYTKNILNNLLNVFFILLGPVSNSWPPKAEAQTGHYFLQSFSTTLLCYIL